LHGSREDAKTRRVFLDTLSKVVRGSAAVTSIIVTLNLFQGLSLNKGRRDLWRVGC
jgi:hypothetical protein